jgi:hypothetical protein
MSWLGTAAKTVGSWAGKGILYLGAGLTAFGAAVGATPYRNDSVEVFDMAAAPDRTGHYGSVSVSGDTGFQSGSIEFKPWEEIPCWYGCSGELFVHSPIPEELLDEPEIPSASYPTASLHILFEDKTQTYDPGGDIDPADLPKPLTFSADISGLFEEKATEIVSHSDPQSTAASYVLAVPERHVIAEHGRFRRLIEVLDVSDLRAPIPPREFEASEFRELPFYRYTYFVWLENGAIPSNAIPSNYKALNPRIGAYTARYLFDDAFQSAIPSNYWGMIYAIPSNLSRQDLIAMGGDPAKVPADGAIPSNLTVEDLRDYGIRVVSPAIPSNAIPSNAIPSNAIPSNAIPSNAIPANAIPSNAIPANAIPANAIPPSLMPPKLSVLEQLSPEDLFRDGILDQVMMQSFHPEIQGYFMTGDESFSRAGRIVVDEQALESGELRSLISDLWEEEYGVETAWSSRGDSRVYMACSGSCETVALPYTTGREQAPYIGVETVSIGPSIGIETVHFGETVVCTEDLSGVDAWLGHKYSGAFSLQLILPSGESYQSSAYQLSIDNQLQVACVFDPENPGVLHCIRPEGITPEREVDFVLRAQPSGCEVWGGRFYVCPYDETYHAPNPWWDGSYGLCCSNGCWCTIGGQTGCWNNCPGCDH